MKKGSGREKEGEKNMRGRARARERDREKEIDDKDGRWRTMFQDELSPSVSRRFFIRIHLVLINNPRAILQFQSNRPFIPSRRTVLNTTSRYPPPTRYHNWKEDILLSTPCNLHEEDSRRISPLEREKDSWTSWNRFNNPFFLTAFFPRLKLRFPFFFLPLPPPRFPSSLSKKKKMRCMKESWSLLVAKESVVWSRTNLKEACSSWRRVNGLFSCVGVFWGVPGPLPEPLFFRTLFKGTAWNLGSFAGISSTLDVSMVGSGCDILGTYMLSSSSTSKSSSSSVVREI